MSSVFEVQKLCKKIGDHSILEDISFSIQAGECFGLLGSDGAGKSSILKSSYGHQVQTSGEIFVLGLNTKSSIEMVRRKIGIVPQENGLDVELTVSENFLTSSWYFDLNKQFSIERTESLLNEFKLNNYRDHFTDSLNKDLKKKVALAKALLHDPEFLVFDEPTRDIDSLTKKWIWSFLKGFKSAGKGLLISTKDTEEATAICDRIAILDRGEILCVGHPSNLVQQNLGIVLVEFSVRGDELQYFLKKFNDTGNIIYHHKNKISVGFQNENHAREFFTQVKSDELTIRKPTLSDLFIQLSGHTLEESPAPVRGHR